MLNTILGGSFTSRLNQNLRETNGYTYGAGSSFAFRPVAGPFVASADVQTAVTGPALTEFFRELEGVRARVPDDELAKARNYVALSFPEPFETVRGTASMVADLFLDDLPLGAYDRYTADVLAVTGDDLERVAAEYVDPARVAVIVVGDRETIEADVRALDLGPVQTLTIDDVLGPPGVDRPAPGGGGQRARTSATAGGAGAGGSTETRASDGAASRGGIAEPHWPRRTQSRTNTRIVEKQPPPSFLAP